MCDEIHLRFSINLAKKDDDKNDDKNGDKKNNNARTTKMSFLSHPKSVIFFAFLRVVRRKKRLSCVL